MSNVQTDSPTMIPEGLSITDLGKLIAGEEIAAPASPAAEPKEPASEPAPPAETKPEAVAAEPPAAEPDKTIEAEGKTADTNQEPVKPKEKSKQSWQDKRLSQLAHSRDAAKAETETERRRAEQLQRELEALKAQPGPKPQAADAKPPVQDISLAAEPEIKTYVAALKDGEEYDDAVTRFVKDHAKWGRQETAKETAAATQAVAAKAQAEAAKVENARIEKQWKAGRQEFPDFDEIVERVVSATPEGLQKAITALTDDEGTALWPKMAAYLDEHPEQLASLAKQFGENQLNGIAKLGRLAAALSPSTIPVPTPATQTAPKTAAKPALKPPVAVGSTPTTEVDIETEKDLDVRLAEYKRLGII